MTTTKQTLIAICHADIEEITFKLSLLKNALIGENTVIRMAPGLYMAVVGNCATPVGIQDGVTCYSPENAVKVLASLPKTCSAVLFRDALETELAEAVNMLESLN